MSANLLQGVLKELGLSPFTVQVYMKCLDTLEPNITKLSELLAVDRSKVYSALKEISENGLMVQKESYSREIVLEPPTKLIAKLRDREIKSKRMIEDLTNSLPDISLQYNSNKRHPYIKIYEGKTQFIEIFNQVLNEADKQTGVRFFGNTDTYYDLINFEYHMEWTRERIKKGIPSTILCFKSQRLNSVIPNNKRDNRRVKWLAEDFPCQGSYFLFANKSLHWNPVLPKAVLIEDQIINSTFNTSFETLWKLTPEI